MNTRELIDRLEALEKQPGLSIEEMGVVLRALPELIALARDGERLKSFKYENAVLRAQRELAIRQLSAIRGLTHPDGFVVNGNGYSFHPPIELVRETWEALSKAIRGIDISAIDQAMKEGR